MAVARPVRENECRDSHGKDSYAAVSQARPRQCASQRARLLGLFHHARLRSVPTLLLRRLHGPSARDGPFARPDGRAGQCRRRARGVLRLHRARVSVPCALRQPIPASSAQARVCPVRAVRHGPRCGRGRACGGVGRLPVPAGVFHRVHHPHGVRGVLCDVVGGAPGCRGVGRARGAVPSAI